MVFRDDPDGLVLITQPAHAWVSGQLARHWGHAEFGGFSPFEEVCLAAELHDIGFLAWENAPTLNPRTGWPHDFLNMPTGLHLDLWSASVSQVRSYNRYSALLVSLHLTHLCQNNKVDKSTRGQAAARSFIEEQQAIQSELLAAIRSQHCYAAACAEAALLRNRRLLAVWDWLSLIFCKGLPGKQTVSDIPARHGLTTLHMETPTASASEATVWPWPFRTAELTLVCEGRRLKETFADESKMREALRQAPHVPVQIRLAPA